MKTVTITEFRKNIFRMVDEALETGEPIAIERKGGRVILTGQKVKAETDAERAERWRKFWDSPPELEIEDLSLEEIEAASEAYWEFNDDPTLRP